MRLRTRRHLTLLAALAVIAACRHGPPNIPPSIGLLKVATLGSHGGPGAIPVPIPFVARDRRGRFYVTLGVMRSSAPYMYDSTGRFLRTLGRVGDGPDEFRNPGPILFGANDTMFVFDQARLDVLGPDQRPIRRINGTPADLTGQAIRLSDGRYVVNAPYFKPPNSLLLYDTAGHIVRAFAPVHGAQCAGCIALGHVIATSGGGRIWAASELYEYMLELWDSTGVELRSFTLHRAWFPPFTHARGASPDSAPTPVITGIWEGTHGNVWVAGITAAPHWMRGLGPPKTGEGGRKYYPIEDQAKTYDLIIDEIDPDSGSVIAERRFPEFGMGLVIEPGLIGVTRQDADGWWYVDVYYVMSNEGHD